MAYNFIFSVNTFWEFMLTSKAIACPGHCEGVQQTLNNNLQLCRPFAAI